MSIDVNVQNNLVIVTESSEDITVNVSNATGADGVGVPTGGTTGQVLKKFSNTNYDTYWAADASGLTSVGLSMPSAFAVSNSPLTSNGTIAVTGAGTASQYIRGDGQLANFPDNGGGGSSVNYYLNGSVTQGTFGGTTYYEMSKTPVLGAGTNFTRTNGQGNGYIASFITDAGDPSLLNIPGGNWTLEFYFQSSASGGSPKFYAELYKVSSADVFTLVASGSSNPEGITNGTTVDQYFTSIPVPQTSLLVTDRLAIRIYVIPTDRTITLHTENGNLCEVLTTFSTGLNALNGLTAQVQYFATGTSGTDFAISSATDTHTFNLPTASATNRGALSSADWSTFSGKVGGSGTSGQVAYWNGTSSQTGSNNLFWDAANSRLGIGTNTPSESMSVEFSSSSSSILGSYIKNTNSGGRAGAGYYNDGNEGGVYGTYGSTFPLPSYRNNFGIVATKSMLFLSDGNTPSGGSSTISFITGGYNNTAQMTLNASGRLLLGTTTDGGQRLQVQGEAFIKGSGAATNVFFVQSSGGNNLFYVQNAGVIGFTALTWVPESTTAAVILTASASRSWNVSGDKTNTSGTGCAFFVTSGFAPTSGTGLYNAQTINPTINQTGGANGITRGLYINPTLTAAADWRSIEWSNNSGWGLYGAGTANNYLGGALTVVGGITLSSGSLSLPVAIHSVFGGAYRFWNRASNRWTFEANNANIGFEFKHIMTSGNAFHIVNTSDTSQFLVSGAGNTILGSSTDAGFKLDVNGTARVSGAMTLSSATPSITLGGNLTISSTAYPTRVFTYDILQSNIDLGGFGQGYFIGRRLTASAGNSEYVAPDGIYNVGSANISAYNNNGNIQIRASNNGNRSVEILGLGVNGSVLIGGIATGNSTSYNAIVRMDSTTQGFMPPRMTTTQKNAIASPTAGLMVYDTTLNKLCIHNGTSWETITSI